MTAPMVPPDVDLRDFHFMPLDVARLINSDLAAIASGEEFKAAVILWCKCWHQIPASSLPSDERMLAHLAGYGRDMEEWKKVKDVAMRGFVLCSDGRFYHPVIAEKVIEAWNEKQAFQRRKAEFSQRQKARVAKRWQRERDPDDAEPEPAEDAASDTARNTAPHTARTTATDTESHTVKIPMKGTGTGTGIIEDTISPRAREPTGQNLEAQLREAAGWQSHPATGLFITGPIQALIEAGASLDQDVLPIIRARAPKLRGQPNWSYFVPAIADARDRRIEAGTIVTTATAPRSQANGTHRQKPSRDETFAAIDRSIDELERRQTLSGAAAGGPRFHAEIDEGQT